MPLPVIADVYRCAVEQHIGDQLVVNVIHVQTTADVSSLQVAEDVAGAWGITNGFSLSQSEQLVYDNVHVTKLDGVSLSADHDFADADHQTGAQVAAPVPSNVALVLSLQTGARGRSHRGRIYLAGEVETEVESPAARWDPGLAASVDTQWGNFVTALAAGLGLEFPVVASYKLAEAFPITRVVARTAFGTQRLRARV